MKNCFLYGFISALAGAFLYLVMYFAGLHSDVAKLTIANWVGGLGGLAIGISTIMLGMKARRAELPPTADFGYGAALWVGTRIAFISAFLSAIFVYCYNAFINTGFADIMMQAQAAKMEAKGVSSDQIEKIQEMSAWVFKPVAASIFALIIGGIFGFILSLIIAAFMKRSAPAGPGVPPPV
jgi:hypothetical protein